MGTLVVGGVISSDEAFGALGGRRGFERLTISLSSLSTRSGRSS